MTGAGLFLRHFLWRDRWMLLWWSIGSTVLYWSQAVSVDGLYRTQAEFDRAAALMGGNAAFVAMADQDDAWYPDKLSALLGALDRALTDAELETLKNVEKSTPRLNVIPL